MRKKLISLLLAAVMLCTVSCFAVSAKDQESTVQHHDIEVLKGLGLLDCVEHIPEEKAAVTRAEFISMIMYMLTHEKGVPDYTDSPFVDVDSSIFGFDYICAAYDQGIVQGNEGRFFPSSNITYPEVVKILIDILGYHFYAQNNGGYPEGYLKIASELKLTKGVSGKFPEPLTFGNAATLYLNALNTQLLAAQPSAGNFSFEKTAETMMESRLGIYQGEGVLRENQFTSLDSADGTGRNNCVTIGDYSGFLYKSFDPEKYFGYYVEYYYRDEDDAILHIEQVENKNNVITITDSEIDQFSFSNRQIVYSPNGKKSTSRKTIPADAVVIVNGKNKPRYTQEDLMPQEGSVTLISNNSDNEIDVVLVNSYTKYFIGAWNKEDKIVVDYYDNTKKLDLSEEEADKSVILVDADANMVDFDTIKEHMVISAVVSEDGSYVRGTLSDKTQKATVQSVQKDAAGKPMVALSDGNSYRVSSAIGDKANQIFPIQVSGTVYFDSEDRAAGFITEADHTQYGFYIRAYNDDADDLYVKLLDVRGEIHVYKAAEKFRVDGSNINNLASAMPSVSEVILYTLDTQGNIKSMDTEEKGASENDYTLTSIYGKNFLNNSYYPGFNSFRGKLWVDDRTIIFICPKNPAGASEADYVVTTHTALEKRDYEYKGYTTNQYSTKPDVIHVNTSGNTVQGLSTTSKMGVVTELNQAVNKDGEIVTMIKIVNETGEASYQTIVNSEVQERVNRLSVGDYVAYNLGMNKDITNIDYIYNVKGEINTSSDISNLLGSGISFFSSQWECQIGYVHNKEAGYIGLSQSRSNSKENPEDLMLYQQKEKTKVFLVDTAVPEGRGRVREADWTEIQDYLNHGQADRVVLSNGNCDLKLVVIYK